MNSDLYVSLWLRLSALLIDILILSFVSYFIINNIFIYKLRVILVAFGFTWLYFTLLNSSKWEGTVGKNVLGIKLVDNQYQKISFKQANVRFFTSLLSFLLPPLYLTVVFTKKKLTIHDMIVNTIVVKKEAVYDFSKGVGNMYKITPVMGNRPTSLDLQMQTGKKFGFIFLIAFFIGFLFLFYYLAPLLSMVVFPEK